MKDLISIEKELDLSLKNNKYGTDKQYPKKYLQYVYNPILHKLNRTKILIEIGVRTGASLALWAKAFPEAQIIGLDNLEINPELHSNYLNFPNIKYIIIDAYSQEALDALPEKIDIIIDDGPHSLTSQIFTATKYISLLSLDGMLLIEDVIGGNFYINTIINQSSSDFQGCIRVFDLRKITKMPDAIVILFHNCRNCSIKGKNYNSKINRIKIKIKCKIYYYLSFFGLKRFSL